MDAEALIDAAETDLRLTVLGWKVEVLGALERYDSATAVAATYARLADATGRQVERLEALRAMARQLANRRRR